MKKIMSLMLCFAVLLSLAACSSAPAEKEAFSPVADGAVVGEGSVSFPLVIVDKEGGTVNVTVNTDKETVGEALMETGLIEGENGDYGIYIKAVNGITADYEVDATYWAFYINDTYALTGVESTPIVEGETYMLKVES